MDRLLIGLIAIGVGALVAAYGARGFFVLLPLFGFIVGFGVGAQIVANLFGDGFFATVTSWGVGFAFAVVFAILAGLWWWAAVVILFGVVGYELGSGVLIAIGLDPGLITVHRRPRRGHRARDPRARARCTDDAGRGGLGVRWRGVRRRRAVPAPEPDHGRPAQGRAARRAGRTPGGARRLGRAWAPSGSLYQYIDTRRIGLEAIERSRYRFS